MRIIDNIDDLFEIDGDHLGHSEWKFVTQEEVNQFAEATGDHQWIHVDVERAAQGPFGGTVAHGYFTLSLIPALTNAIYRVDGIAMGVNYGCDKVRFPSPVPVGSRIRAGAQLIGVEATGSGARMTVRVTIEVEGGNKPACVADTVSVMFRP